MNGIRFPNPVLTAAGPNVRSGAMMLRAAAGGAGGIVSKTLCPRPARDPRPTIRRTSGGGLLNCESWSETAPEDFLPELHKAKASGLPLIVSIGYLPEEVSRLGALIEKEIEPAAIEFSTHYTGGCLEPLLEVAGALRRSVRLPIWMKLSPGFPNLEALVREAAPWVDAFVAVNSYGPVLDFDLDTQAPLLGAGAGWLSGPPLLPIALRIVSLVSSIQDKPVIGVGGIERGEDAVKHFLAGASLVQVCSAAIRRGHGVYGRIAAEAGEWLDRHGFMGPGEIRGLGGSGAGPSAASQARPSAARRAPAAPAVRPVMRVEEERCTGCRACLDRCLHEALFMEGGKARVLEEACIGCGFCQDFCGEKAMSLGGF